MKSKKILIVDDEHGTVALITRILQLAGYQTTEAYNSQDAIKTALNFLPDLIIMDIVLPDMDGAETVRNIFRHDVLKKTKVIFISSLMLTQEETSRDEDKLKIQVENVYYDAIAKPFETQNFLKKVKAVLGEL